MPVLARHLSTFAVFLLCTGGASAATLGIAAHIAAGVGLASPTASSNYSQSTTSRHNTNATAGSISSSTWWSGQTAPAATGTGSPSSNVSATGDCWDQWNSYWTAEQYSATGIIQTIATNTITTVYATTYEISSTATLSASIYTTVQTRYGPNNNFPVATETVVETHLGETGLVYSKVSTGPSHTSVTTWTHHTNLPAISGPITTPACRLPTHVPQCQSQWNNYISEIAATSQGGNGGVNIPVPLCSQASVNSQQCEQVVSERYALSPIFGFSGINAWLTNGSSTWWPTSSSLAPSCTLGCQSCAITGNTVQILYWPPSTATAVENGNGTLIVNPTGSSLQRAGSRNGTTQMIAIIDNTTLTSPTVYISYKSLYASNSCSQIGRRYSNTIIPLAKNADLSSLAYQELGGWAPGPGQWGNGVSWHYIEKPFNFSDLVEPIPNRVWNQLPWCQSSMSAYVSQGGEAKSFTCQRNGAYAPLIAVPTEVKDLDPAWDSCTAWYGGLYDPPTALQGASAEATPTVPAAAQTTTSVSAQLTADPGLPEQTSTAYSGSTTPATSSSSTSNSGGEPASTPQTGGSNTAQHSTSTPAQAASDPAISGSGSSDPEPTAYGTSPGGNDPTELTSHSVNETSTSSSQTQTTTNALSVLVSALSGLGSQLNPSSTDSPVGSANDPGATTAITSGNALPSIVTSTTTPDSVSVAASASGQSVTAYQITSSAIYVTPNASTIVDGQTFAAAPSGGLVVGSQTIEFAQTGSQTSVLALGSQTFTVAKQPGTSAGIVIANQGTKATLQTGGFITLSPQAISTAQPGGPVIGSGSQTQAVTLSGVSEQGSEASIVSIGSQAFTITQQGVNGGGVEVANGGTTATLTAGGSAVTVGGQIVSVAQSDGVIIGTGSGAQTVFPEHVTSAASSNGGESAVTIGGQVFTASSRSDGAVLVKGQTSAILSVGGPAATFGTQLVSADSSGQLVAGSSTITLPSAQQPGAVFTLGGSTVTASMVLGNSGEVVVAGKTLSEGAPAQSINGEGLSMGASGLVVDGSETIPLSERTSGPAQSAVVFTLGSSTLTATGVSGVPGEVVFDGTTLSVGGPGQTIGGEGISEASDGLVLGGSTTMAMSRITSLPSITSAQLSSSAGSPTAAALPSTSNASGGGRALVGASAVRIWVSMIMMGTIYL